MGGSRTRHRPPQNEDDISGLGEGCGCAWRAHETQAQGLASPRAGATSVDLAARLLQTGDLLVGLVRGRQFSDQQAFGFLCVSTSSTLWGPVSRPVQTLGSGGRHVRPRSSRERSKDLLPS